MADIKIQVGKDKYKLLEDLGAEQVAEGVALEGGALSLLAAIYQELRKTNLALAMMIGAEPDDLADA